LRGVREQRLVFGEEAELYDRARPTYPGQLLDYVVALAGVPARALDIGCGTGKATVLLAARGVSGIALDAHPAMAELARRNLAPYRDWVVEVGDFERWRPPPGPRPFDLTCSAQAWHWLDPSVRFHKVHDLLREGGWLALWWNGSSSTGPVAEEIDEIYAELVPEITHKSGSTNRDLDLEQVPSDLTFRGPLRKDFKWAKDYSAEQWVALLRTQSDHMLLATELLCELTARVRSCIESHGGYYHQDYVCRLATYQKGAPDAEHYTPMRPVGL